MVVAAHGATAATAHQVGMVTHAGGGHHTAATAAAAVAVAGVDEAGAEKVDHVGAAPLLLLRPLGQLPVPGLDPVLLQGHWPLYLHIQQNI